SCASFLTQLRLRCPELYPLQITIPLLVCFYVDALDRCKWTIRGQFHHMVYRVPFRIRLLMQHELDILLTGVDLQVSRLPGYGAETVGLLMDQSLLRCSFAKAESGPKTNADRVGSALVG